MNTRSPLLSRMLLEACDAVEAPTTPARPAWSPAEISCARAGLASRGVTRATFRFGPVEVAVALGLLSPLALGRFE